MNVTVPISDDLAARLGAADEVARRALEAFAASELQAGRLTEADIYRLLSVTTTAERKALVHGQGRAGAAVLADDLVARFRSFAARHTLGGLDVKELIAVSRSVGVAAGGKLRPAQESRSSRPVSPSTVWMEKSGRE